MNDEDWPVSLTELAEPTLTAAQGFRAMYLFLGTFWDRTKGLGELRTILDDIEIDAHGRSTDPAALGDWLHAVRAVLAADA